MSLCEVAKSLAVGISVIFFDWLRMHSSIPTVVQNDGARRVSFSMSGAGHVVAPRYSRSDETDSISSL